MSERRGANSPSVLTDAWSGSRHLECLGVPFHPVLGVSHAPVDIQLPRCVALSPTENDANPYPVSTGQSHQKRTTTV